MQGRGGPPRRKSKSPGSKKKPAKKRAKRAQKTDANEPFPIPHVIRPQAPRAEVERRLATVPRRLRAALYPFQADGLRFCIERKARVLIGDEMGLGKTVQAIATACAYTEAWPVLVVVPAVVKLNWAEEIERWVDDLEPGHVHVVRGRKDVDAWRASNGVRWVIATYGLFTSSSDVAASLCEAHFEFVIVDESHYLKSHTAARTKLVCPIVAAARHALLLSGTPALARPSELYSQVSALNPSGFGTFTQFSKYFCNARRGRFGWDTTGASHLPELSTRLTPMMLRRKKADVLTELPPKIKRRVAIELPAKQAKEIALRMETLRKTGALARLLDDGGAGAASATQREAGSVRNEHRRLLVETFQTTGIAKIPGVKEYLTSFLLGTPKETKCIVFAHHRAVLDGIEEALAKYGSGRAGEKRIDWMRIDGNTPHKERTENTRKFQTQPGCRVAVLGMTSGGIGITLTAASHVFFAELHWTPGVLMQAEDRAHRIGQTETVQIHYLVARGTLDEKLWRMVTRKVSVVSTALHGKGEKLDVKLMDQKGKKKKKKTKKGQNKGSKGGRKRAKCEDDGSEEEEEDEEDAEAEKRAAKKAKVEALPFGDIRSLFARGKSSQASQASELAASQASEVASSQASSQGSSQGGSTSEVDLIDLSGVAATPAAQPWSCTRCTLENSATWLRCEACDLQRPPRALAALTAPSPSAKVALASTSSASSSSSSSASASASASASVTTTTELVAKPPIARRKTKTLYFCVSEYSGRVYLYSSGKAFLKQSFLPDDLVGKTTAEERVESLPPLLHAEDGYNEAAEFCAKWTALRAVERVTLCAERRPLRPPLHAELNRIKAAARLLKAKKKSGGAASVLSFARYSKAPSAAAASSSSSSSSSAAAAGQLEDQEVDDPNSKLCVSCHKTYDSKSGLPSGCCTWECHQLLQVKLGGTAIRRQLFELEGGICQICDRDMHQVFRRYKSLEAADRVQELMRIKMSVGGKPSEHQALLHNPKEGMFWQADHILPVSEGGGECSLHNLRTLCTPCHRKETALLRTRLKAAKLSKAGAGSGDIAAMFGTAASSRAKTPPHPVAAPASSAATAASAIDLSMIDAHADESSIFEKSSVVAGGGGTGLIDLSVEERQPQPQPQPRREVQIRAEQRRRQQELEREEVLDVGDGEEEEDEDMDESGDDGWFKGSESQSSFTGPSPVKRAPDPSSRFDLGISLDETKSPMPPSTAATGAAGAAAAASAVPAPAPARARAAATLKGGRFDLGISLTDGDTTHSPMPPVPAAAAPTAAATTTTRTSGGGGGGKGGFDLGISDDSSDDDDATQGGSMNY